MSLENLSSIGHDSNVVPSSSSGGGQGVYSGNSGGKESKQFENFINEMMNSNQMKVLTFGLSTIFDASKNILPDISNIFKPFSIGSILSGLSLPTPGKALGLGKKGASR